MELVTIPVKTLWEEWIEREAELFIFVKIHVVFWRNLIEKSKLKYLPFGNILTLDITTSLKWIECVSVCVN